MATFPSIEPDFGSTENSSPRVRSVQFGDGYVQRLSFGLNTDLKVWNLSWTNITDTDASTIEDFLEARKGSESFSWSPPNDSSTYKWICPEWQKQLTHGGVNKITAKFQQVADL